MKKDFFLISIFLLPALALNAEEIPVPYLPNGLVDMEQVVPTFSASFPIYSTPVSSISGMGTFLGVEWTAEIVTAAERKGQITTVASGLARDADALLAVWASSSFCSFNDYPYGVNMIWAEAEFLDENSLIVPFECLVDPEGEGS